MRVPEHLQHKPVVVVDDYDKVDGIHKGPDSDAKGLSIGKSQWNQNEISAKVWRHKEGSGWSRQSEELPLHRVLDLAILILSIYDYNGDNETETFLNKTIIDEKEFDKIKDFLNENKEELDKRVKELKKILKVNQ